MGIGLNSEILFHVFKALFLDTVLTSGSLDLVHFQEKSKKKFCCLCPLAHKQIGTFKNSVCKWASRKSIFFSEMKHRARIIIFLN